MAKKINIQKIQLHVSANDTFYLLLIDNPFYYSNDDDVQNYQQHLTKNEFSTIKLYPYSNCDRKGLFSYFYLMFNCNYFTEHRLYSLVDNLTYMYIDKTHLKQMEATFDLFVQVHSSIMKNVNNNDNKFYVDISNKEFIQLCINSL